LSQLFNSRRLIILITLVALLLTVIGLTKDRPEFSLIEKAVLDFTAPLQKGFTKITNSARSTWQGIAEIRHLKRQKEDLAKQVRNLRDENRQLKEQYLENQRLRMLLEFRERIPYNTVVAQVIGRSADNWFSFITIDQGTEDGLKKGMAVVGTNGLVGQISGVTEHTSRVLLILDQNSAVSGLIQETRENGIVEGMIKPNSYLVMKGLPRDAKVKKGDHILSSGLGGIFPKGLFIGRVAKVEDEPYGISKRALVTPAENFNSLEEVLVITNNRPLKESLPGQEVNQ